MKLFKFSLPFIVVVSIILIQGLFFFANGLDDLVRPYAYTPRDTIKAYKLDTNEKRLYVGHNKLLDTLDLKFARYTRFKDTTFDTVKAKYFKATDSVASVLGRFSGKVNADSVTSTKGIYCTKINTGLGNFDIGQDVQTSSDVVFDSIYTRAFKTGTELTAAGTFIADSVFSTKGIKSGAGLYGTTGTLSSTASVDSLFSTKGIMGTVGNYSSTVSVDSLFSTKGVKGTNGKFSGTVNVDSMFSTKGIKSGAGLYGTTGTLTSTLSADSVFSTKGIKSGAGLYGTTGTLTSTLSADSVFSTKGIKGTVGKYSSTVSVDSLFSTKGIRGTGAYYTTGLFSSTLSADSIFSTTGIKGTIGDFQSIEVKKFLRNSGVANKSMIFSFDTVLANDVNINISEAVANVSVGLNGYLFVSTARNGSSASGSSALVSLRPTTGVVRFVNLDTLTGQGYYDDSTHANGVNIYYKQGIYLMLKNKSSYLLDVSLFFIGMRNQ